MDFMNAPQPISVKCPSCGRPPAAWKEWPEHGSRELYWIGCRKCGHLEGGVTQGVALQRWDRTVARLKFQMANKKQPTLLW